MSEKIQINVAVSILADISLGIYRTPANAFKELISNAFDADASKVVINTGYHRFKTMTCWDNGNGLNSQEFKSIMSRIGGSDKRKGGREITAKGRPIIGKIGIGILAIAQICKRFTIISSKNGYSTKFEAVVDFTGFAKDIAKEISLGSKEAKAIGSYELNDGLPEEEEAHYTKIILEEIEPGFREKLLEGSGPEEKINRFRFDKKDPKVISDFVTWLTKTDVRLISDYNRLIWELGIICPIPYLENGPVRKNKVITEIKKALLDYNFSVRIDGLELFKPIILPTDDEIIVRNEDFDIYPIGFDDVVAGKRLTFKGYIFYQRKAIRPPELRGILIRVRNIAIGMYDRSLLNYPTAQGPKMAFISGEIYVEEGLEDALNIDRNSFRETNSHYLKLLEVVYTRLGGDKELKITGIFTDITKRSRERNIALRGNQVFKSRKKILTDIKAIYGKDYDIEVIEDDKPEDPIQVYTDSNKIYIFENHPIFPRAKTPRAIFERVLISYELAAAIAETRSEIKEKFYRLLKGG
jgi:hypothetical protein